MVDGSRSLAGHTCHVIASGGGDRGQHCLEIDGRGHWPYSVLGLAGPIARLPHALGGGSCSTEADPLPLEGPIADRTRPVNALLALASRGVRAVAVRMPRTVHNHGRGGFGGLLANQAKQTALSPLPVTAVTGGRPCALGAARLFRRALESAPEGIAWRAVAAEGDAVRDIAAVIGRRLGLPVQAAPECCWRWSKPNDRSDFRGAQTCASGGG